MKEYIFLFGPVIIIPIIIHISLRFFFKIENIKNKMNDHLGMMYLMLYAFGIFLYNRFNLTENSLDKKEIFLLLIYIIITIYSFLIYYISSIKLKKKQKNKHD